MEGNSIMASDLQLNSIQLGNNADASKNFVLKVPLVANGTMSIERGDGAAVLSIDAAGKVAISGQLSNSQTAKAWVNFDATRNVAGGTDSANTARYIRSSFNVASVVKQAAGSYVINFTSALSDSNYAFVGMGADIGTANGWVQPGLPVQTAAAFGISCLQAFGGPTYEPMHCSVTIFGN